MGLFFATLHNWSNNVYKWENNDSFFVYRTSLNHLYLSIHKTKCKELFNSYSFEHFYFILQTWVYKIGGKHN